MSVYKALRGDSSVQFVETARKLAVHTRKCCLKMPKRYTFYGAQELSALADTVYNEVKMANSVFPGNQHEAQLRRDHLIEANATLQALIGQLGIMADLLKQNPEKLRWLDNSLEEWASLISEEAKLISGVKKSDKERFKNLPEPIYGSCHDTVVLSCELVVGAFS